MILNINESIVKQKNFHLLDVLFFVASESYDKVMAIPVRYSLPLRILNNQV